MPGRQQCTRHLYESTVVRRTRFYTAVSRAAQTEDNAKNK